MDSKELLIDQIIKVLKTCYDPEVPVDIYEMGLIYDIALEANGLVRIKMTLTSPGCPVAESLPVEIREKVQELESVSCCEIELVWEPEWTIDRMSDAAKLELGLF